MHITKARKKRKEKENHMYINLKREKKNLYLPTKIDIYKQNSFPTYLRCLSSLSKLQDKKQ